MLNRRQRKKPQPDSSDEESNQPENDEKPNNSKQYRDLETFQKAQLRQKVSIETHDLVISYDQQNFMFLAETWKNRTEWNSNNFSSSSVKTRICNA